MSYTATKTYIDTYVNTNGVRAITGAILNTALNYMLAVTQSERRAGKETATVDTSNIITFEDRNQDAYPFPSDTVFALKVNCYDADGNNVDFQITASDVDGFTIVVAADCTVNYCATELYQTIPA